MPKTLTPEDIKLHVTDIFNFISQESKTYTQIQRHNWRFRSIKNILIKKNIIFSHYKINSKKTYYKSAFLKLQEHHVLQILKEFQNDIKKNNERLAYNFIKKDRTNQLEINKPETNISTNEKLNQLESENTKLKFQLNIETTANGCFKQRIRELERIESFGKIPLQAQNENLTNKIEESKKEILEKEKNIESLENSLEKYEEKIIELTKRNKKYITEYSAFINEKLEVIENLKKQLHQQQSEKNQISVIKVLGIPLIKKTTKTIK